MKLLLENWRKYLQEELGGAAPMTFDEMEEHGLSHEADREGRDLVRHFRRKLKRDAGRVWGDEAKARREREAEAKAVESVVPKLMAALELPPGEDKDRDVKYLVYVASSIQHDFYEPPAEEKTAFVADPRQPGAPVAKRLTGTIPSLNIDLGEIE